jgi:hypothetical protein
MQTNCDEDASKGSLGMSTRSYIPNPFLDYLDLGFERHDDPDELCERNGIFDDR